MAWKRQPCACARSRRRGKTRSWSALRSATRSLKVELTKMRKVRLVVVMVSPRHAAATGRQSASMTNGLSLTGLPQRGQGNSVPRADAGTSDQARHAGQPKAGRAGRPRICWIRLRGRLPRGHYRRTEGQVLQAQKVHAPP